MEEVGSPLHHPPPDFEPLWTQRVPLGTILRYPFLAELALKLFQRSPWRQIITEFERGERAKKTQFLAKIFRKSALERFLLAFFFKNLPAVQKIWSIKWTISSTIRPFPRKNLDPPLLEQFQFGNVAQYYA